MKTHPTKYDRSDWENDNWNNRGNHEIRWTVVTDSGIPVEVPGNVIDQLNDGESVNVNVASFYYQFGSPCTTYRITADPVKSTKTPTGDDGYCGSVTLIRRGYRLIAKNIDCVA